MGVQMIIQAQCEALVEKFNVNPLICGIVGPIWLRFVAGTGIFDDDWADEAICESESQDPCCYVAREAVLPTDIVKWSVEGKLTYFNSAVELEKVFGPSLHGFPLSLNFMFTPSRAVPPQNLEVLAALVAESIGLNLPPVNFYTIASRYLKELSLPVEKILPSACRLLEWLMPPELWLSTNEFRLPTRVCVMSILIIAIRILYNINGFGAWERSLSSHDFPSKSKHLGKVEGSGSSKVRDNAESELDAVEILCNLEARYSDINPSYGYSKDLPTYLQFCKNVFFAGLEPPIEFYHEEKSIIDQLWHFYENEVIKSETEKRTYEDTEPDVGVQFKSAYGKGKSRGNKGCDNVRGKEHRGSPSKDDVHSHNTEETENSEPNDEASADVFKERAIRQMKADIEENEFCYIPPRIKLKSFDYIHYARKKDEGFMAYVAHADYCILLRSCARLVQVDIRVMHLGTLSPERRLGWVEKRIDHCLHLSRPDITCEFCTAPEQASSDPVFSLKSEFTRSTF